MRWNCEIYTYLESVYENVKQLHEMRICVFYYSDMHISEQCTQNTYHTK